MAEEYVSPYAEKIALVRVLRERGQCPVAEAVTNRATAHDWRSFRTVTESRSEGLCTRTTEFYCRWCLARHTGELFNAPSPFEVNPA